MGRGRIHVLVVVAVFVAWCWHGAVTPASPDGMSLAASADRAHEPEGYAFDGVIYLRTFRLMERGADYYHAYAQATREDARNDAPYAPLVHWRQPFLAMLWSLVLPDSGSAVMALFVAAAALCLVAAHAALAPVYGRAGALAATVALAAYYHYGATSRWFPFHEWWGAFWVVVAACAVARGRLSAAAWLALPALLTREHFVVFGFAGALTCLLARRWREAMSWGGCLVVFGVCYGWHAVQVARIVGLQPVGGALGAFGGVLAGPLFLGRAAAYGWVEPAGPLPGVGVAVPLIGLVGLALLRGSPLRTFLWLGVGTLLGGYFWLGFSYNQYSYYWGAVVGPFILLGWAPLVAAASGALGRKSPTGRAG